MSRTSLRSFAVKAPKRDAVAKGFSRDSGYCLDGRAALLAALVCLSRRRKARLGAVGDLQNDGVPATAVHYEPGNDCCVDNGTVARLGPQRLHGGLVSGQIHSRRRTDLVPSPTGPLAQGFR